MEPIRVLQVVGRMDRGGIETMIMNLYRHMDRDRVQFDFLAHYGREAAYNAEIRAMGGRIYEMPALKDETRVYYERLPAYLRALDQFFAEHREYRVVHGHMTNTAALYMKAARRHGVPCRIAHSHNTHGKGGLQGAVTALLHSGIPRCATHFFACSEAAKHWFYPPELIASGRVRVVANAIDTARFRFAPDKRRAARQALGIADELVVICVARFRPEKNQSFLLDVLRAMRAQGCDATLVFVGDGPCEAAVRERAGALGLAAHTRFLGARSDVPELLCAADAFALPSRWEGLPLTVIEAQASGLHGVVSEGLPREMDVQGMVRYLPLDAPAARWAETLIEAAHQPRLDASEAIRAAGYDIRTTAPWLQAFYLERHFEGLKHGSGMA